MVAERSLKAQAWDLFDRIVAEAAPRGVYSNPWRRHGGRGTEEASDELVFAPDYAVLRRLLAVPLRLQAPTTTGVPALALDVWVAYELRRAGLDPDAVWPRAQAPRILPGPVARLLSTLSAAERAPLEKRLAAGAVKGVTGAAANVLGKNYLKQVDVVMADWDTGPELLISTKRMDSSFGKNAANRVEESYGDAKNLRLRHPLAALGFVYGLRSTILDTEPEKAEWLIDLLQKLGQEDDAYHAVALIMIDYDDHLLVAGDGSDDGEDALEAAGIGGAASDDPPLDGQGNLLDLIAFDEEPALFGVDAPADEAVNAAASARLAEESRTGYAASGSSGDRAAHEPRVPQEPGAAENTGVAGRGASWAEHQLPEVRILEHEVPPGLQPGAFLATMVCRVLDGTPVNRHREARRRRREASDASVSA